jgi:hypothetical protein
VTLGSDANTFSVFKILDNGRNWLAQPEGLNYTTNRNFALQFDGVQNALRVPVSGASLAGGFTVECWYKYIPSNGGRVLSLRADGTDTYLCVTVFTDGSFYLVGTLSGYQQANSGGNYYDGAWHHLALTYDNTTATLFVDGAAAAQISPSASYNPDRLLVCANSSPPDLYRAAGTVDEVRLSNYPRDIAGWWANRTCATLGADTNTLAYFQFNESGSNPVEQVVGGPAGILEGTPAPGWVPGIPCSTGQPNAQNLSVAAAFALGLRSGNAALSNSLDTARSLSVSGSVGRVQSGQP